MAPGDPAELFNLEGLGFLCLLLSDALRSILPSSFPILPYTSTLLFDAGRSWPPSNSGSPPPNFPPYIVKCILAISAWMSLSQARRAHRTVFSVAHPLLKWFSQPVLSSICAQGIPSTVSRSTGERLGKVGRWGAVLRDLSIVCRSLVGPGRAMQR